MALRSDNRGGTMAGFVQPNTPCFTKIVRVMRANFVSLLLLGITPYDVTLYRTFSVRRLLKSVQWWECVFSENLFVKPGSDEWSKIKRLYK